MEAARQLTEYTPPFEAFETAGEDGGARVSFDADAEMLKQKE